MSRKVEERDEQCNPNVTLQRSTIRAPRRLIEESSLSIKVNNQGWRECLIEMYEYALVGAGIGGGSNHSSELNVIKYNQAMRAKDMEDIAKWIRGMDKEHAQFLYNDEWVTVLKGDYNDVIPITMTWALKLKASGVIQARCNMRGFEQILHVHYDSDAKSLPVTTQASIFFAFTILMMRTDFRAQVIDVKACSSRVS
jgi:hypothetical protein